MKNRVLYYGLIASLVLFVSVYIYQNEYVEFRYLYFNKGFKELSVNKRDYDNLIKVFKYYSEKYEIENGNLFIKRQLMNNKDMISNYTKKAQDTSWLRNHNEK